MARARPAGGRATSVGDEYRGVLGIRRNPRCTCHVVRRQARSRQDARNRQGPARSARRVRRPAGPARELTEASAPASPRRRRPRSSTPAPSLRRPCWAASPGTRGPDSATIPAAPAATLTADTAPLARRRHSRAPRPGDRRGQQDRHAPIHLGRRTRVIRRCRLRLLGLGLLCPARRARALLTRRTPTGLESFGEPGPGQWITIYANAATRS